jgi:hypothetical protein
VTQIWFDVEANIAYTATIYFAYDVSVDGFELYFYLSGIYENGEQQDYWRWTMTAFIPNYYRLLILDLICLAARQLIREIKPVRVTMRTIDNNIPNKGRAKYSKINEIFTQEGYLVEEDPVHGFRIWNMTLPKSV